MPVDAARHARVKELFLDVRELPAAERPAALDRACVGDAALRAEVESLLSFDATGEILAPPARGDDDPTRDLHEPVGGASEPRRHGAKTGEPARDPLGLVGTTLDDRYRVEALVAEGGFGYVYRAEQVRWARPVAVKVLKLERGDEAFKQAFVKEGALLSELSRHTTAIVQSYDVGTCVDGGGQARVFLVLEWLDGRTLADVVAGERRERRAREKTAEAGHDADTPWPLARVLDVLAPVAEALGVAHARRIAHRDVKPANIFLVDQDGRAATKLLDFGVAKIAAEHESGFHSTGGRITAFTIGYAAPEQISKAHGTTGPWTDVYALALVCVELLAGRRLSNPGDPLSSARRISSAAEQPTPRRLGVAVSSPVEAVFSRALALDASNRYPDVTAFWSALVAASSAPDEAPPARAARRPAWTALWPLLAVGLAVLAGLSAWLLAR